MSFKRRSAQAVKKIKSFASRVAPDRTVPKIALIITALIIGGLGTYTLIHSRAATTCSPAYGSFGSTAYPPSCWRPFSDASPFNQALPSNPQVMSGSNAIIDRMFNIASGRGPAEVEVFKDGRGGEPTYYSKSTDPEFTIHCTQPWGTCMLEGQKVRIPAGARTEGNVASSGNDSQDVHMTIVDQTTNREYDFWQTQTNPIPANGGTLNISWGGYTDINGTGLNLPTEATAAKWANLAGRTRAEELLDGQINHALFIVIGCDNGKWVYPAYKAGSKCTDTTNAPPMGARLQLDYSDSEINALSVPDWKKTILRAMAKYGMFFGDTGTTNLFWVERETGLQYTSQGQANKWLELVQRGGFGYWDGDGGVYLGDLASGVDWHRLRVIDPCVSQGNCPAPSPAPAAPLSWAPPTLSSPTTINIGQGNTLNNLDPAKDYIIKLPASRKIGSTALVGGHNIVIKGGLLTIDPASVLDDVNGRALYIKNATGTVHIEGVYVDNTDGGQGDAVAISAPEAIVQLENMRIINLKGTFNSSHADCVQPWGGVKELRIDHFTCTDMYQGLQIDRNLGAIGRATIKNTNLVNLPNTLTSDSSIAGGYSLWFANATCDNAYPIQFSEVYIVPKPGRTLANSVWPAGNNQTCPAVPSGTQVSWPALSSIISGNVKLGPPAGGDFVPAAGVGLNYTSPGYNSSPPPADTSAPDTTISAQPASSTTLTSASFSFSSSEANSTFTCKLDSNAYSSCTSPKSYTNLATGTHTFSVRATDAAGNVDGTPDSYSWTITAPTPPPTDSTAPTVSFSSPSSGATVSGIVTATAAAADDTAVTKVDISLDGSLKISDSAAPYNYSFDSKTLSNGSHTLSAKAYDAAGHSSVANISVTVNNPDVTPPTAPTGLSAVATNSTTVNLTWTAASDPGINPSGVVKYNVLRNGVVIAQPTTPAYTDTNRVANTAYTYTVQAMDAAGNVSSNSNTATITTPPPPITPDTTAPSVPGSPTATAAGTNQVNLAWGASTDTGGSGLAGYNIYRGSTKLNSTLVTSTSYGDSTVQAGTTYSYMIEAVDGVGNKSAKTAAVSATTPDAIRGDVTGPTGAPDGSIDLRDISYLIRHYNGSDDAADISGPSGTPDGKVDIFDLSFIIRNYGK